MSLTLQIYLLSILLSIKMALVILLLVSLAIFVASLLICVSMYGSDYDDGGKISKEKKEGIDFGISVIAKSFICVLIFGVLNIFLPSKNMCYTIFAAYSLGQGNLEKVIRHLEGPTKQIIELISNDCEKEEDEK